MNASSLRLVGSAGRRAVDRIGTVKPKAAQVVKSVARTLGLEVHRRPRTLLLPNRLPGEGTGTIVEMFGFWGAGKTTLLRHARPQLGDDWISMDELRGRVDLMAASVDADNDIADFYERMYRLRIENVLAGESHRNFSRRTSNVNWVGANMLENLALDTMPLPVGVLQDEGIVSCFHRELGQLLVDPHPGLARMLDRRVVVYVAATPEEIVDSIGERRRARSAALGDLPELSEAEIYERATLAQPEYAAYVAALSELGVPILTLQRSDDLELNTGRFVDFVRQHRQRTLD